MTRITQVNRNHRNPDSGKLANPCELVARRFCWQERVAFYEDT